MERLDTARPSWAPPEVDIDTPSIARVYDYWIGGTHNFPVDRELGDRVSAGNPGLVATLRANRAFLRRSVRELSALGIRQFLDIGSGIPAEGNVHDVALSAHPDSTVVYVDIDPVAVAHGRALLADEPRAAVFQGDLHQPQEILQAGDTRRLIDFDRPVALILAAVLHFVPDGEDPLELVRQYTAPLVPGSALVLSHAGADEVPRTAPEAAEQYRGAVSQVIWRSTAELTALFDGFDLISPGVVRAPLWRPAPDDHPDPDLAMLAGVALKPGA
ncbi:SAM-dependent methyltransferase [Streptomyces yaanensis]|uniref:SAM-dependent methyltransferase n=1 Tax=Streptomyces yaanensis TaxID=1142239 RepID=A0ABV7SID2_9ACTN|nr:SAM-dependent methyltransferase [Streptomyces sp. CGMCC 4.7035]WNC01028.1 SAM-dependent methyltransferase [Streptomyces sp. CGMCC 4.7035]